MSWSDEFSVVAELATLAGRAELDAHLAALEAGTAGTPVAPALGDAELAAWHGAKIREELMFALGLQSRAKELLVVVLGKGPSVALTDADGRPLALLAGAALLDDEQRSALLGERPLVLVGAADSLYALHEALARRDVKVQVEHVIADHVPLLPGAAQLLHEIFDAPVGEGLRDDAGGWLALARRRGELLVPVRKREELLVITPTGDQLARGQWGLLGVRAPTGQTVIPVCACLQTTRDGEAAVELGVPATPLGSSSRPELNTVDLHDMLGTLPVFAYFIRFETSGTHLSLSLLPGRDDEATRAEVLAAIAPGVEAVEVEFGEPGIEFAAHRVHDGRGIYRGRVVVMWAGEAGSDTRRAGWRQALVQTSMGSREVELRDATTDEAVGGQAAEVLAELARDGVEMPKLFGLAISEPKVYVGDATADLPFGRDANGWISLLDGDDEHEPIFVCGADRGEVALVQRVLETGEAGEDLAQLAVDGITLQSWTRPIIGRARDTAGDNRPLWVDDARCVGSGDCVRICPVDAITLRGEPARPSIDVDACVRCHLCVERCEVVALRPIVSDDSATDGALILREAAKIAGARRRQPPRALDGKLVEPPAQLDRRRAPAGVRRKPTVVLGLATVTLMEHAAALLVDGELVAAIEEERLARVRHYTWKHPERPGTSLSSDICLRVEEAWPTRAIEAVLGAAKLTMDDVDLVAVNGIPARLRKSFIGGRGWRPPPVLRANSLVFVPHHMSHAACVYGLSDFDEAWVLSIDGRGDYETATVWRAEGNDLDVVDAVPWLPDCSFGGVYETATRVLGFGTHGQGSTMALAALGEPTVDLRTCMSLDDDHAPVLSEWAAEKLMAPYTRGYDDPLGDEHENLAASIQLALETTVGDYLAHHAGDLRGKKLAMCGGVALNCRMNGVLRDRFAPADMYVAPAANDAGTAIGAAIIGHRELTGELPRLGLGHTHLGPAWSDDAIAAALQRMRVPFQRLRDVGDQTAELLAGGRIVCWFQGRMEFGPRALGSRSILADPRRVDLKERLNVMKSRQSWRPFGSSVLAGRQGEWFVQDWDSRFMLFAVDVRPEKRDEVPVIVHFDGSTRPQIVHAEHHPRYHELIAAFDRRTGVPMVVNTSFNRGGEPIVCNPVEAMRSFVGLGADAIVLGNCLVRRELLRRR